MYRSLPFLLIILLTSCKIDSEDNNPVTVLNENLERTLVDASDGLGLSHYILPESDDFVNIPQDPKNPITVEKVKLGKLLYHETGLAISPIRKDGEGRYSCASCHFAGAGFQAGRHQGIGEGGSGIGSRGEGRKPLNSYQDNQLDVQPIRTPTAMNGAYQELMLWNGQFGGIGENLDFQDKWTEGTPIAMNHLGYEGLEIQAIAGLGVHRLDIDSSVLSMGYQELFDEAFPEISPENRYTKEYAGLAIAAYERTLLSNQAPFQRWLKGDMQAMSASEKQGAILFFDKAQCYTCHSGPALNSMEFFALGMHSLDKCILETFGTGPDVSANLGRGGFTGRPEDMYKFKVPQLYNLKDSPFYGHGSSFEDIREVVSYKNLAIPQSEVVPTNQLAKEFTPLGLTEEEIDQITSFLEISLNDFNLSRYEPDVLLSGQCFPNNDPLSKQQLGCE